MFLHLLLGDLQATPAVARHLGNQYKLLQCLKLEVIHENQLIEYGLISKDSKFESLFPFQQTIHIPLDNYFASIDRLVTDEDLHNSNLQKLSFTVFAVLGREQLVKLGTGVLTSSPQKDAKVVSKTVIFRNDQFELIAKLALNIAYHESLLDISDLLQLKQNGGISIKQQQEQEYAFLLSRKFRRSEADFPATFDFKLDRKLQEDTKYYIEGNNKSQAKLEKRARSIGKERPTAAASSSRKPSPKHLRRPDGKKPTEENVFTQPRSASKARRKVEILAEEVPKLRKTAMTVGFVHNNWPDPLEHEKEKKEFQLRMADERKQLLLQQIRQEIDLQRQRASFVQEQHRHQDEIKKEKKRKKQLAKELKNRELEIKKLQEELQNIRLQSLLSAQKSSPPPPTAPPRYHSPFSSNHHRSNQTSNPRASPSDKKRRSASSPALGLGEKQKKKLQSTINQSKSPSYRVATYDQRIDQLINSHYGNFFKQVTPQPKVQKTKDSLITKKILSSYDKLKSYQSKGSPNVVGKPVSQKKLSSNKVEHGNNVIKVSITRSPSPKISKTGPIAARYQSFANEKEREVKERSLKRRDTFEFHDVYQQVRNDHQFDSDCDFAQLSQEFPKSASKSSAKKSVNQSSRYDLEEMNLLDDNADHLHLFEKSMMDEMSVIHRAIESKSDDQQHLRQEASLLASSLNPMASVNESIRTDSTSDAYKVPGFLHTIVQQPKSTEQNYSQEGYFDTVDLEEDDEEGDDDKEEDVSDSEFERRFHLQTDDEFDDGDSDVNPESSTNLESKRQIDLSSSDQLIFPSKDFNYSEISSSKQKNSIFPHHTTTQYERTYSSEIEPASSYGKPHSVSKSDMLNVDERLDSRGRSEIEFRHSRGGDKLTSETTAARSRSREKALQRLERNRQYSSPVGVAGNSSGVTGNYNVLHNTASTAITTTSTSSLPDYHTVKQQLRNIDDDEREEDHFSQLDAVLRRTNEEITNAIKDVSLGANVSSSINDHQKIDVSTKSHLHQMDISLSDDDTIENNILDTVAFNAKLMKSFSSDSEDKAKKSTTSMTVSKRQLPTISDPIVVAATSTTINGVKEESSSALSSRSGSFDENKIINAYFTDSESDNVEDEEEESPLLKGKHEEVNNTSDKSENGLLDADSSIQSKLDRISTRINNLFSESSIDLKHLVSKDLLSAETNNNSVTPSAAVTPLSTDTTGHDFNLPNETTSVKSPLSEKRSVSFASKIEEVREINGTAESIVDEKFVLKEKQEIDFTKPKLNYSAVSNRSLIERQFEKNRKYSSTINPSLINGSTPALSNALTTESNGSLQHGNSNFINQAVDAVNHQPSTDLLNPTSEKVSNLSEMVSEHALDISKVPNDQGLVCGTVEVGTIKADPSTSNPDKAIFKDGPDISHFSSFNQPRTTEESAINGNKSRIKSIITQFEKNQKYSSSSAIFAVESISHPSMKISPQIGSFKKCNSEDSSNNQRERENERSNTIYNSTLSIETSLPFPSFIPAVPNSPSQVENENVSMNLNGHDIENNTKSFQSETVSTSAARSVMKTEWNEIEAALDKLELRVKTSEVLSKSEINLSLLATDADDRNGEKQGRTVLNNEISLDHPAVEKKDFERGKSVHRRPSASREEIEQSAMLSKFSDEEGEDNFDDSRFPGEDSTFLQNGDDSINIDRGEESSDKDDDDDDFEINILVDDSNSESDDGDD